MKDSLSDRYRELFLKHGDTAQAVLHFDAASQRNRFRVISEFADHLGSVVDVGCGLGHFYDYLKEKGFAGRYLGLDFVAEFVEHGNRKHAGTGDVQFRNFDMRKDSYPEGYDTHVFCGVFNNRLPGSEISMEDSLAKAFAVASKGIAFSALSTYVDFQDGELSYVDPLKIFHFCKTELSRRVVLRHDYLVREDRPPYEFTIYVYK